MEELTREQIEKMEAGPEMDRLVAERVLRFTHDAHCNWPHYGWPPDVRKIHGNQRRVLGYSTDIAAVFDVLNAMVNKPGTMLWSINGLHPDSGDAPVFTFILTPFWSETVITAEAASIPLAISRAALLTTLK